MRIIAYIGRRMLYIIPQLLGISIVTFAMVRMLPGNPANIMAGGFATEETIEKIERQLGLDKPLYDQYFIYLRNVLKGDLGSSWYTSNPVIEDFAQRVPATLELITLAILGALMIGIPLGVLAAIQKRGGVDRVVFFYGLLAGSLPDFWVGLILIFLFYYVLRWLPAPIGRIDISIPPPDRVTGMYLIDSLVAGRWDAFVSSAKHLVLPVMTLVFVYAGPIIKMTRSTMEGVLQSDYIEFARASGLGKMQVMRQALRNSLPPVVTIIAVMYGFMISGAVLVESVFGWGGLGQYAVQSIKNSDFAPIQAFVLVTAIFTLVIYLVVDLIYFLLDPRIKV